MTEQKYMLGKESILNAMAVHRLGMLSTYPPGEYELKDINDSIAYALAYVERFSKVYPKRSDSVASAKYYLSAAWEVMNHD